MNRIETALQALQEKKEKAFITYITAGLPDYDKTKAIIKAQEAAGTDIIELGSTYLLFNASYPYAPSFSRTQSTTTSALAPALRAIALKG
ncbi:MAG: tryptophan synthase subunit alpha, partial [Lachnospiraceae bacterium]|nr:tryptophan synthase subunit alpha [Lachnospiraceae bacterium]